MRNTIEYDQTLEQTARLRQVLRWIVIMCCVLAPIHLAVGTLFHNPMFLLLSGIALSAIVTALLALRLLHYGRARAAVLTMAILVLGVGVVLPPLLPAATAGMTITPLLAAALLLPYLSPQALRIFCGGAVLASIAIFLLGQQPPLLPRPPALGETTLGILCVSAVCILTLLLLWQFSSRLTQTLEQVRSAHAALGQAYADLEQQVAARTADLQAALADARDQAAAKSRLVNEISQQRELIREMSVPILPISTSALVLPLIGTLDSARLETVQAQALAAVAREGARYLLLDITGVTVIDTQVAQALLSVVQAVRLLGADVVLVGERPEVAQAVVGLGLNLGDMVTQQSLQQGIAYTRRREGMALTPN